MTEEQAGERQITIVVADDHRVVRAGLRLLLQAEPDMHVVGEAGDVPGALRLVASRRPHVLVLDLTMPGRASLGAIPELVAGGATRVVVLTARDDPGAAQQALRSGASGYVLKEAAGTELVTAVRAAAEGRTYLSSELGARLAGAGAATPPHVELAERELALLRLVALGHTNAEIAARLHLSLRTVESLRSQVQRKLGHGSRAEMVRYALDHGLLA